MWGSRGIAQCIIHLGSRCRWVVNSMPWLLYAIGKSLCYPFSRRMGEPRRYSGCFGEEKNLLPMSGIEPWFHHYLACILFTIWTELPQLIYVYVALYATVLIDLCFIFVLRLQCWPWKVNIDVTANFLSSQKLSE